MKVVGTVPGDDKSPANTGNTGFAVRFWGARGTIPCPGPAVLRYGGNTACVELRCGAHRVILDAGSGLRSLGLAMLDEGLVDADILFSHFHIDHVMGLPVFDPAYRRGNMFRLWAGSSERGASLEQALRKLMGMPLFPVGLDAFKASISFRDFRCGDVLELHPGLTVATAPLNHPGGAVGYRVEHAGKVVAYVSDTEHPPDRIDENALTLARGADLVIYDATYTDEEYPQKVGWGHSTWTEGVKLAAAAGAKVLALFHHDPSHDDDFLDAVAVAAAAARSGTLVAREGAVLHL